MGSGEILVILLIALVVLGPEKLPKLAADIGRWVGRARAMARQLRSQLDQEVYLEEMRREQAKASSPPPPPPAPPAAAAAPETPAPVTPTATEPAAPSAPASHDVQH